MTIALCLVLTLKCVPMPLTDCTAAALDIGLDKAYCRDLGAKPATGNAAKAMRRALEAKGPHGPEVST